MPFFLRRLLDRPSGRVSRAVLFPLSVLYGLIVVYALFVAYQAGNRLNTEKLAASAETLARTWDEGSDAVHLARLADVSDWDRVWIVSTTGRIVSSSRIGEEGAVVDASFWDGLETDRTLTVRNIDQGGQVWIQAAAKDVVRGRWAMIVAKPVAGAASAWVRLASVLILAVVVWLLMASAVVTVVHRRLGRGYDMADAMAARILGGEAIPASTLNRDRAELTEEGAPSRILALASRLQEQAERAREAESRFAASIDATPDAAYLASFDGRLLLAGSGFRRRMQDPARPLQGRALGTIESDLPVLRIHEAANRLREAGVTVDRMPIEVGDTTVLVSVRPVSFRGTDAYLAHVEDDVAASADSSPIAVSTARDLLDASEDLFIAFDAEARTILWNRTAERTTGVSRQEVPDLRRVVECILPDPEQSIPFMDWLESQPGAGDLEGRIHTRDGLDLRVRWHAHELLTDGSVIGGALVARILGRVEYAADDDATADIGTSASGVGVTTQGLVPDVAPPVKPKKKSAAARPKAAPGKKSTTRASAGDVNAASAKDGKAGPAKGATKTRKATSARKTTPAAKTGPAKRNKPSNAKGTGDATPSSRKAG